MFFCLKIKIAPNKLNFGKTLRDLHKRGTVPDRSNLTGNTLPECLGNAK